MTSNISDPSTTVNEIGIPAPSNFISEFTYNFYTRDERVSEYKFKPTDSIQKIPRYVTLKWDIPVLSQFERQKNDLSDSKSAQDKKIEKNYDKVMSADNFFDSGFLSHTFSNVEAIEQGSSDLENYSRLMQDNAESIFKMSQKQIQRISS